MPVHGHVRGMTWESVAAAVSIARRDGGGWCARRPHSALLCCRPRCARCSRCRPRCARCAVLCCLRRPRKDAAPIHAKSRRSRRPSTRAAALSNDQLAWNRPCAAIRFCYDGRASWIHAQLQLLASTFACTHGNQLLGTARALQSERCGEYLTGSCVNKLPRGYNCS